MTKLIVARDQKALYDYFRWGFSDSEEVEVVLDRRLWQRRARESAPRNPQPEPSGQRRRRDRRSQSGTTRAELVARGFVIYP